MSRRAALLSLPFETDEKCPKRLASLLVERFMNWESESTQRLASDIKAYLISRAASVQ